MLLWAISSSESRKRVHSSRPRLEGCALWMGLSVATLVKHFTQGRELQLRFNTFVIVLQYSNREQRRTIWPRMRSQSNKSEPAGPCPAARWLHLQRAPSAALTAEPHVFREFLMHLLEESLHQHCRCCKCGSVVQIRER